MTRAATVQGFLCLFATAFFVSSAPLMTDAAERHHDAHEHGVSALKLAIDGNTVAIELRSPGSDIVGFEHTPATDADRKAIASAADVLAKGAELFVAAPGAGCQLIDADIDAPGMEGKHGGHDAKHDHGHAHKDSHKADSHADGHADGHADVGEDHSEFKAQYRFRCQDIDKLTHVDIKLFERFPRARELDVQAITPAGQFVRELKPGSARLAL